MDNRVKDLMERGFSELTPDCFDQIMAKVAELPQPEVRTEELNRTHTYERARVKQRRVVASFATAAVAVFCLSCLLPDLGEVVRYGKGNR